MAGETVWGLDIGQCALKAVRGRVAGQLIEVLAFDHVEYRQPLSTAGTDSNATIREALQTFLSRNDVEGSAFAVSIAAGRSALIRFIKLPPVDRRKVPDIVRYEATQQIPFPLEDVIWDHQVVERNYGPGEELEVGIFAMRREAIFDFLSNLMVSGIEVENIQLSAVALYNCVHFDQLVEEGAIMAVDIGAENTNLVVVEGNNVWTRSLPIGGNDFTRAIATKYGLEFDQAEQLKRSMDRSKKAPEIFEALRPSLRSLLDEIQRSAGYYRSIHKSAKFIKLIGFGNGFKMYGVQRFLEAGLAYPVEVFQKTNNFVVDAAANQQFFKKSAPAFGAALGLVAQTLGFGGVRTSLMPPTIIKERILKKKRPALIAAAVLLTGAFVWPVASAYTKPATIDLSQHPIRKIIQEKSEEAKNYQELVNTKKWEDEVSSLANLRSMRAEQLKAFDALAECLPKPTDLEGPYYIQQMAVQSGGKKWLQTVLRKPEAASAAKIQATVVMPGIAIVKPVFIAPAAEEAAGKGTAVVEKKTKMSAEDRAAAREKVLSDMEARMDEARMRRNLKADAKKKGGQTEVGSKGTRLTGATMPEGIGIVQLAQLWVESPSANYEAYFRDFADRLSKGDGVMYCSWVSTTPLDVWERSDDHTRVYEPPRDPEGYTLVKYHVGLVQWVYKEGSKEKIVFNAGGGAAAGKAAAKAAAAPGEPMEPGAPMPGGEDGPDK